MTKGRSLRIFRVTFEILTPPPPPAPLDQILTHVDTETLGEMLRQCNALHTLLVRKNVTHSIIHGQP